MDIVTDLDGNYEELVNLNLKNEYKKIIEDTLVKLKDYNLTVDPTRAKYMVISKGLSTAAKVVIKIEGLYPFLAKIDKKNNTDKEYEGYQNLQFHIDSANLLSFIAYEKSEQTGLLLFRYITKGRVKYQYERFDTFLNSVDLLHINEEIINLVDNIFDSTFKKCHWGDGHPNMHHIKFKPFEDFIFDDNFFNAEQLNDIEQSYIANIQKCEYIYAPHGRIHGDLHPKNILIGMNNIPIIIDFTHVKTDACIFKDYAKLETFFLFQVPNKFSSRFFEKDVKQTLFERHYSVEPLILPRSVHNPISRVIQEIRTLLWKNCLSLTINMNYHDIDAIYRAYLTYYFIQLCRRAGVEENTRKRAYKGICYLSGIIYHN
ncbi:phosphotransferase [Lacrimispora sp.]|uniref:phosphotransferase n=1 Tax=Lacrimispora sp. TaxID=2719234 RepID=UPI00289FD396|nr:phosphotransferase [Lacrimispora sp.]